MRLDRVKSDHAVLEDLVATADVESGVIAVTEVIAETEVTEVIGVIAEIAAATDLTIESSEQLSPFEDAVDFERAEGSDAALGWQPERFESIGDDHALRFVFGSVGDE